MRAVRSGALVGWLVAAVLCAAGARAQVATTTVQDTVTDASGAPETGSVLVSWGAFTTAAGSSVPAGSLTAVLGTGGVLSVALQPNAGATPMGSYYTAVFHLSDGTASREFWVVPVVSAGTVKLASIRNQVLPLTVAMQTVSKQYVDTTVAKAMTGTAPGGSLPYVLKTGDTMTGGLTVGGPLTLATDPVLPLQAADKHYVDAAVSGVTAGSSTGGSAGGDLSGTFPNPTVQAVHASSGTLNGVTIGAATPAAGTFLTGTFNGNVVLAPNGLMNRTVDFGSSFGAAALWLYNNGSAGGRMGWGLNGGGEMQFFVGANSHHWSWNFGGDLQPVGTNEVMRLTGTGVLSVVGNFRAPLMTPASSGASCTAGDFGDDANFHYVCVADSTWKRVALSSF